MISNFFNNASMHPVKTALCGAAIILAVPFLAPFVAPVLGALTAPVASLATLFGFASVGTGSAYAAAHTFRHASDNPGKVALGGLGLGIAAPFAAPVLGTAVAAFAAAAAPWVLLGGATLMGVKLFSHLASPRAPQHA
jgi:hypothetical protein